MRLARIVLAAWLVGLAGCGVEYPSGDAGGGRTTALERLDIVQRKLVAGSSDIRSLSLPTPCILRLETGRGPGHEFSLQELQILVDTDAATGHFTVMLRVRDGGSPGVRVLATPHWADMMVVRAELNQLRAHCAESLLPPAPAGP